MAQLKTILGQPSWPLASHQVQAYVTQTGGQLGPVTFRIGGRSISPLSVAPWATEPRTPGLPPILQVLRGDFFCLPFGGNTTPYRGEQHPVHGETANARWRHVATTHEQERHSLHLRLQTKIRPGQVDKRITLVDGQAGIYQRHTITGMTGPMNLGHHAMVKYPDQEGCGVLSTSRFLYGQVFPAVFESPANKGYSALLPGARFATLREVPLATGHMTDLSRYPARRGFEDLAILVADTTLPLAWSAVTFPGERYVWFSLKNPRVLPQTVLWFSNGGRYYHPWNGRHTNVLGVEEGCSYFHLGLAEAARRNPLSAGGSPTVTKLHPGKPLDISYFMGVVAIPPRFDRVADISLAQNHVVLRAASGKKAQMAIDPELLAGLSV